MPELGNYQLPISEALGEWLYPYLSMVSYTDPVADLPYTTVELWELGTPMIEKKKRKKSLIY